MSTVTPANFAQAHARQQALTDAEWLLRGDELAQQQTVVFMELLTFRRDGATGTQPRALVDYLSTMQFVAEVVSAPAAAPVALEELRAAVRRTGHFFHAINTDDRPHFERMIRAWHEGRAFGWQLKNTDRQGEQQKAKQTPTKRLPYAGERT